MKKMSINDAVMGLLHETVKDSAAYSRYAKTLRVVSSLPIDEVTLSKVMDFLGYWKDGKPVAWLQREIIYRAVRQSRKKSLMEGK